MVIVFMLSAPEVENCLQKVCCRVHSGYTPVRKMGLGRQKKLTHKAGATETSADPIGSSLRLGWPFGELIQGLSLGSLHQPAVDCWLCHGGGL